MLYVKLPQEPSFNNRFKLRLRWVTKYHYDVFHDDRQDRCQYLLIQVCNSENVHILKGVVSKDHMNIKYSPS